MKGFLYTHKTFNTVIASCGFFSTGVANIIEVLYLEIKMFKDVYIRNQGKYSYSIIDDIVDVLI